jgi:hypothetical protein
MNLKCLAYFACASMATATLAADVSYRSDIRPLIKDRCLGCHGDESPALADFLQDQQKYKKEMQGPRLSTYGELIQVIGWPETGVFMRRLDDGSHSANKKPGNMYRHLGDTDAERAANLNIVKAWVGDGAWIINPLEKSDDVPAIAKDQIDKLKLKY